MTTEQSAQAKDVSTVVSLLPYEINIDLPTVFPGRYLIPEAEHGKFELIHVIRARTDVYIDSDRGFMQRPILSEEIAQAIVHDHISANICVERNFAEPGLFSLPGAALPLSIHNSKQLERAKELQKNWYIKLVEQADSDWQRTGSSRAVGMLARKAAVALNLRKEWNTEQVVEQSEVIKCPMCVSLVSPDAVVCMVCKFVLKKDVYEKNKNSFTTS